MIGAEEGLRRALARGSSRMLSKMSTEDIVASLSDEQKAKMAKSLGLKTAKDSGPATNGLRNRTNIVLGALGTDPLCEGKTSLAVSLLAQDDLSGLSATAIIKLLRTAPPARASGDFGPADLAAVIEQNLALGLCAPATPSSEGTSNHGWDGIHADLRERRASNRQ